MRSNCTKLSYSEVADFFEKEGCKLLSETYSGVTQRLRYVAICGHEHSIEFYCFKRGQGRKCPVCSGNAKKSIDEVRAKFLEEGCELISSNYKWNREKLDYVARCGHRHRIKASAFFEGEGRVCPECQRMLNALSRRKHSQDYWKSFFNSEGCELITKDVTTNSRVRFVARCGHENEMRLCNFIHGYGRTCRSCTIKRSSIGEKQIREVLDSNGIRYQAQYQIKSKRGMQRLDFFIEDFNAAIEFNGRQHYEENEFFHRRRNRACCSFESQVRRDDEKRQWCASHGVKLIEIDARNWTRNTIFKGPLKQHVKYLLKKNGWLK